MIESIPCQHGKAFAMPTYAITINGATRHVDARYGISNAIAQVESEFIATGILGPRGINSPGASLEWHRSDCQGA